MENKSNHDNQKVYQELIEMKKRIIHLIVDYWIMGYLSMTIFWFILGIFSFIVKIDASSINSLLLLFINLVPIILYFIIFEKIFGKTVGKMLTKTIVLTKEYKQPSTGQIILRSLIRFIPFEPLSVISGELWHDKWSGTIVATKKKDILE